MFDDGFEAVSLVLPGGVVEAVEGDHFAICGIEDGDGGVVLAASPVDAGDVGVAGLGFCVGLGGGGFFEAAEDGAVAAEEGGFVFGSPDEIGGVAADVLEFFGVDEGVVGGGEVEGLPVCFFGIEAEAVEVVEPVAAFGRGQEEGGAACRDEHGADDFVPGAGLDEGGFIEDDEVETFAAEVIGPEGAAEGDHAAVGQIDAAFALAYLDASDAFQGVFEIAPDLVGHFFGGRQPPAAVVILEGVDQYGGFAEFGFAPAASAGGDFEAGGVLEDFNLILVERCEFQRAVRSRCLWVGVWSQGFDHYGFEAPVI